VALLVAVRHLFGKVIKRLCGTSHQVYVILD
jgi:hypothetical protein